MLALFLFFLVSANPLDCIGTGIDTTKMQVQCLANIFYPTDDQIFEIDTPESQLIQFSVVMQSLFNIDAYYHEETSSSGFLGFGSSSKEVYRYYHNYYNENKSLTKIMLTIAFTKFTTTPMFTDLKLDMNFVKTVNDMPLYDNSSFAFYSEFISTWGTDVLYEIVTGGKFETNIWYDNMINEIYSEEKISEYSGWSFAGIIGDGHGSTSDNIHIDKKFNQSMSVEYYYLGGNVSLPMNHYLDWAVSVKQNEQIIKYEFLPITFFVANKTAAYNLNQAIMEYGKKSNHDLEQYISSLKN